MTWARLSGQIAFKIPYGGHSTAVVTDTFSKCQDIYLSARDLNSGSHIYSQLICLNEPSSQPPLCLYFCLKKDIKFIT